jgi:PAS domain S-box-containing protein
LCYRLVCEHGKWCASPVVFDGNSRQNDRPTIQTMTSRQKIYLTAFVALVAGVSTLAYFLAPQQLPDTQDYLAGRNKIVTDLLAKQVQAGINNDTWVLEGLNEISRTEDFLFWWIVRDDGAIHLADRTSSIGTRVEQHLPHVDITSPIEKVVINQAQNYGLYVFPILVGKKNWSLWLGFSLDRSRQFKRNAIIATFGTYAAIIAVLGLVLVLLIRQYGRSVRKPAHGAVTRGTDNFSDGARKDSVGELAELARSLNTVAANLQKDTIPKAYLETIVDSNKDPLVVIDGFGHVAASNRATSMLLGYSRQELLGMPAMELFSNTDKFLAQGVKFVDLLETGQLSDLELHMLTKHGTPVPVLFRTSITQDEDCSPKYFVATAIGLTEQTLSTKAPRKSSQEAFARSHDAFATFFGRHDNESLEADDVRGEGREYLEIPLVVYESSRPDNRGWVHNISEHGMGLVGVLSKVDEKKRLLIFAEYSSDAHPCEVEAVCRWIDRQAPDHESITGFEITRISEENRNRLLQLVPTLEVDERLRGEERVLLDAPLTVYEAKKPESMALVKDISDHGLRLIGMNSPVGTKKNFVLEALHSPGNHCIEFEAVCRWVRPKDGGNDSDSGFEITATPGDSLKQFIKALPKQPVGFP